MLIYEVTALGQSTFDDAASLMQPPRPDAAVTKPPPNAHADTYSRLSPAAKLVAQLYGIAAPAALGVTVVHRLLARADYRVSGRRVTNKDVIRCNADLVDAGIADRVADETAVLAVGEWVLPLNRIAYLEGNLSRLLTVVDAELSYYGFGARLEERSLRAHLVVGDAAKVAELLRWQSLPTGFWRFLAEPWQGDLVPLLPESARADAVRDCLGHVIQTAAPAEQVVAAALASLEGRRRHTAEAAFIRVLQGRFDAADALFADLPQEIRAEKPIAVAWAATRALVSALRGDHDQARSQIDEALVLERAGTRKRLVFPDCRAFALSLVSLAEADSAAARDLLNQLLRGAERVEAEWPGELEFVHAAAQAKAGYRLRFNFAGARPELPLLLQALGGCWTGESPVDRPMWADMLDRYHDRARTNGFAWVAAECDEVVSRYRTEDASPLPTNSGHAALGTATLAELAAPLPEWEFSLKAFEQLAFETSGKTARKKPKVDAAGKRRLVWDLVDDGFAVLAYPREQRQLKNGSWSKGRNVALQRLARDAGTIDYLLPQDREAAAGLHTARSRNGWKTWPTSKSLYALAGHPHVFNEDGEPVDVVQREPELSIEKTDDDGVRVTVQPMDEDSAGFDEDHPRYMARMATDRRCEVTHYTKSHLRIIGLVPKGGLILPAEARSRVLEAASALAAEVRVQSVGTEGAATVEAITADREPWVRLEPFEAGLAVAIVVEPIPDSGICFEPGVGATTVFAHRDGQNVQTRRDLAAEWAALNGLISSQPALAGQPTELEPLLLPEPDACLELMESLGRRGARCKWPKGEPFRVVARASAPSLSLTVKSADQWLETSGKLAVDESRVLDLKQLFALLDACPQSRFVQLEDGQFLALTRTFRRQLDDLASLSVRGGGGAVRLHRLAAMAVDDLLNTVDLTTDNAFRERGAMIAAADTVAVEVPSTLRTELRPYQADGFRWLTRLAHWGAGACLADDMGLGKTVQALALLLHRAPDGPALVVAPTSVVANWMDEARRFAPTLNLKAYVGGGESRAALLASAGPFDLYVTTYGLMHNDIDDLATVRWRSVVLDEAQAIKNAATKRARAARRLTADFRLVTTGTPIQNNVMDLHSLFGFLNPGLLGSAQHFQRNFAGAVERGEREANARLRRLVAPFLLRRLKTEVLDDLPERTEITLHVRMSPDEAALYEALRQRAVAELEAARVQGSELGEGAQRVQVLAHLTRLRLACCHPRLVLDEADAPGGPASSKLRAFADTLAELMENKHKVLVFSQFVRHLRLVEEYLEGAGISYQYLDGATPAKSRRERIDAFQAGQGDVFLISLKAGGTGLNLTAADYVVHLDPWWNPAVEDQASDRAHRIGQQRPVTIYRLVAEGTVEEQIVDLHRHKRDLADRLLEGADAAARLSADELLALLRQPLAGLDDAG